MFSCSSEAPPFFNLPSAGDTTFVLFFFPYLSFYAATLTGRPWPLAPPPLCFSPEDACVVSRLLFFGFLNPLFRPACPCHYLFCYSPISTLIFLSLRPAFFLVSPPLVPPIMTGDFVFRSLVSFRFLRPCPGTGRLTPSLLEVPILHLFSPFTLHPVSKLYLIRLSR